MAPAPSAAQVATPVATTAPTQMSGARAAQTLKLSMDVQAGRDDNVVPPGGEGSIALLAAGQPGYVGFGNAAVAYAAGRPSAASFELNGQSFVISDSVSRHPAAGGDISMKGHLTVGGRTELEASQVVRSDPYVMLGAFNALPVAADSFSPDMNPQNGLAANRSLSTITSGSLRRNWTRKSWTRFEYSLDRRLYDLTPERDTRSHAGVLSYEHSLSRSVGLLASYNYLNIDALMSGGPMEAAVSQTAEAGFSFSRALSRNRSVTLRAGGGAMRYETTEESTRVSASSHAPTGYASLSLTARDGWQLDADYRRSVSGLNGLLAETYIADAVTVRVAGSLPADMWATFSSGYSTGQEAQPGSRYPGFVTYVSTADLRFLETRQWSAHVIYTNLHYTFDRTLLGEVSVPIPGLTYDLSRNSIRLGLTLSLPVIGPRASREN